MSDSSARLARRNRQFLAVFWGMFGVGCLVLPLFKLARETGILPFPWVVGACVVASAWGFYTGMKWGRIAIGVVVAPLSLLCFDRLMTMHFQRSYGPFFFVACGLLIAGFYTWVFLFTGLDREAPRRRRHHNHDHSEHHD